MPLVIAVIAAIAVAGIGGALFQKWHIRQAARKLIDQNEALYSGAQEYAEVDARSFVALDQAFYDQARDSLTRHGFRYLGDFECLTASRQFPAMRTFIRGFVSDDSLVVASVYHVKMQGLLGLFALFGVVPRNIYTVEFESEFSDGRFLGTNNLEGLNPLGDYEGLVLQQFPPKTKPAELYAQHRSLLAELVEGDTDRTPIPIRTKEEMLAFQDRMHELKSAQRKAKGFIDRDDLLKVAGPAQTEEAEELAREIERQKRERGA